MNDLAIIKRALPDEAEGTAEPEAAPREPVTGGASAQSGAQPAEVVPQTASDVPQQPARPPFVPKPPHLVAAYMVASTLLSLTQSFGMNLVSANIPQIAGDLSATQTEATWLMAAYMAPNVSLAVALIKIRNQFGLRNFAEISILGFVVAALLNFLISDLHSALVVRFMSGMAASPMSSLAFLYMLEPMPPEKKMSVGLSLALTNITLGAPIARIVSPYLIELWGGWHALTVLELALAIAALGLVYKLPLGPMPRANVISRGDVVSYLLIAVGFGCVAVVLVTGRLYWWLEAPWIGWVLVLSALCLTTAAVIELNRKSPLLDIRWLTSPAIVHFACALFLFRIVLAEQSSGVPQFFIALGLSNTQMQVMYGIILLGSLLGGLTSAAILKPGREEMMHVVALILIATGALMDSHATSLTRPEQLILSQAMIAYATALFLPPAMASGLMSALKKGPNYILSFIIVFLMTQSIGGLLGSAIFGTLVTIRTNLHTLRLSELMSPSDPLVAQRIQQYGASYANVIPDSLQRQVEGTRLLSSVIKREATVLAYNDVFLIVGIIALIALGLLLGHMALNAWLRRRAAATAPPGGALPN
ncbi:MFS transporter [Haematobacter genomosp. 1]|nr:MFS transporter [Haematobacter genomosp. 1]